MYDAAPRALRQRTVNFAAKRLVDMRYVSGLDRATAERHLRWRPAVAPGGLGFRDAPGGQAELDRRASRRRHRDRHGRCRPPGDGAVERSGLRGAGRRLGGRAARIWRHRARTACGSTIRSGSGFARRSDPGHAWPFGDAVETPPRSARRTRPRARCVLCRLGRRLRHPDRDSGTRPVRALQRIRRSRPRNPELVDDKGDHLHRDRAADPGGLARLGARPGAGAAVARPARDPSPDHAGSSAAHALGSRISGRARRRRHDVGFENSAVYQDAGDAFAAAQRSIVATVPGSVYRYINSGLNVLGAIIRDRIERRGLPYHETLYGLLVDRLGMASYQHSADIAGNLIASGAGFATLRDYAKLGVLYLQNGMWDGEPLLPPGWADYALTATHTGTSYAACFRSNIDRISRTCRPIPPGRRALPTSASSFCAAIA